MTYIDPNFFQLKQGENFKAGTYLLGEAGLKMAKKVKAAACLLS